MVIEWVAWYGVGIRPTQYLICSNVRTISYVARPLKRQCFMSCGSSQYLRHILNSVSLVTKQHVTSLSLAVFISLEIPCVPASLQWIIQTVFVAVQDL